MKKGIQGRSAIRKTMVTLHVDMRMVNGETYRLLRGLEHKFRATAFSTVAGHTLVWQLIVDQFDKDFWTDVAKGNDFELYTHELDQHW